MDDALVDAIVARIEGGLMSSERSRAPYRGSVTPMLALIATLAASSGVGCAPRRPAAVERPAAGAGITTAADESRLAALIAHRAAEGRTDGYRIGPDDLLEIRIPDLLEVDRVTPAAWTTAATATAPRAASGAPPYNQGTRVGASGDVMIPLLGAVPAQGLTPAALEAEIGRRLVARGILRTPQVTVNVVEHRNGTVAVVGSVERPGQFPLTRASTTVGDLIWAAGGPTKDAGRVVEFTPAGEPVDGAERSPIRLDLEAVLHGGRQGAAASPPVRGGDAISLAPAGTVQVDGWVAKPGSYPVTRGLTLTGAVAAAGGTLFPADRGEATVQRIAANGPQVLRFDLNALNAGRIQDVAMMDGDVVQLSSDPVRLVPWSAWNVVRELVHVGGSLFLF
jgi:polysaccharide export outer membrane protein